MKKAEIKRKEKLIDAGINVFPGNPKKIELNPDQRDLIRNLLHSNIYQHEKELTEGGYTESGILKAINEIYQSGQIIEKLNFEILK